MKRKIRLCSICGEPIYSWDEAWSNEEGRAVHSACFGGLMYRLDKGLIPRPQRLMSLFILFSMRKERNR